MKLESVKDLAKVIALCRKTGVEIIKIDGVEIVLGAKPSKTVSNRNIPGTAIQTYSSAPAYQIDENTAIQTPDSLTPEQMLFYSAIEGQDSN